MRASIPAIALLILGCGDAYPQSQTVRQSGSVTNSHVACWTTNGVVQDCGVSTAAFPTTFGVTKNGGLPFCIQDTADHTGAYRQLCMSISSAGTGDISLTPYNGAGAMTLSITINGVTYPFPSSIPFDSTPIRSVSSGTTDGASNVDQNGTIVWNSSSASPKTETLPTCNSGVSGLTISVKDEIGTANIYPITVTSVSTLDGSSSFIMAFAHQAVTFQCSGSTSNWVVK